MNSTGKSVQAVQVEFDISQSLRWFSFLSRSSTEIITETCAFVLIGLTAIGGNLLVVASIYRNRALRTCTNYFVLSLAITDIFYPLTVLPLTILWLNNIKTIGFDYSQEVCDYQLMCLLTFTCVSGNTIALMAFNRFICVCKPDKYKNMFKKKKTLLMILGVWVACLTVGLLMIKGDFNYARFSPQLVMCMPSRKRKTMATKILGNLVLGVAVVIPYIIITYCYVNIFKKIRHHKRSIAWTVAKASSRVRVVKAHDIKITWTLFAVLLGYLVTWVPVLVVGIVTSYDKSQKHRVTIILPFGMAINTAINPIIYGIMNPAFRSEYSKILNFAASSASRLPSFIVRKNNAA